MRNLEGESILLHGDPHVLATHPTIRDGARNAALTGLREVYVSFEIPTEEADRAISSTASTTPEEVEKLIATAKAGLGAVYDRRAQTKTTRKLNPLSELRTDVSPRELRIASHEIATHGDISTARPKLVR
jgi:hypothetical protein